MSIKRAWANRTTTMRRRRALVVDDAESIRAYLANLLELKGFEVDTAEDGRKGVALLESGAAPDVVLPTSAMDGTALSDVRPDLVHGSGERLRRAAQRPLRPSHAQAPPLVDPRLVRERLRSLSRQR